MKGRSVFFTSILMLMIVVAAYYSALFDELNYEFRGSLNNPFRDAYAFELLDQNENIFRFDEQRGKVMLLFFGYTHCPDVCPGTLSDFNKIYESLGEQAQQVIFVFITVDPDRDTPEAIADYLSLFNSSFIGLTGTEEELQAVWEGYYTFNEKEEISEEHEDDEDDHSYLVAHTSRIFVVDSAGKLRLTFPNDLSSSEMASDVKFLINE